MAIDRLGQKVMCVVKITVVYDDDSVVSTTAPEKGMVYTVDGFAGTHWPTVFNRELLPEGSPGLHLKEVPGVLCPSCRTRAAWVLQAFVPVDERKTDISEIVSQALDVKATEPA